MTPDTRQKMPISGVLYALLAALLFGVTTPLAKSMLSSVAPVLLAGLFYLGSGTGLSIYLLATAKTVKGRKLLIGKEEIFWLASAIFAGGVAAPILLMFGLKSTEASTASLFLNLEAVFTALLAWFVFKENFDRRIFLGMLAIVAGGILLSFSPSSQGGEIGFSTGSLLICAACACWAIDNNLTRKVSNLDGAQIACYKGLAAGITNVTLAYLTGAQLPGAGTTLAAMFTGFLGYGVSLAFFVLGLRHLGTARTGAYFSLAPFVGALCAVIFLHDPITNKFLWASGLMALGLWMHLTETHEHEHTHEELEHEHEHSHDEHHQHMHHADDPPGEPHTHKHKHQKLVHSHAHFPDLHHRHEH